ncbi:hypothetical protein QMK19_31890 [Streptomyces sp. H10-C2]|uniref:hypothetical protein n=1 Tax=unclassified Streptomyces TaxID=2593676 RepID=UPI0024B910E9|nr:MULTISPECIES: hypothetical protein [unclassified Streptomyces]MDJ0345145.1 hypothetical protein [Streptomyces sp. PH10-H1]MDJ0374113.1 hypothetical protein [Streptomyces sp. H10-C2]
MAMVPGGAETPPGRGTGRFDRTDLQRRGVGGGEDLCTSGPGYDAPTGMGTPNGLGAL